MIDLHRSQAITELLTFLQGWTDYGDDKSKRAMSLFPDQPDKIAVVEYHGSGPELVGYVYDEIGGEWQYADATPDEYEAFEVKYPWSRGLHAASGVPYLSSD